MRVHSLVLVASLAGCGGAQGARTLRSATSTENEQALTALRTAHGADVRVLETRAIGAAARVLVVYAHTDAGPVTVAATRMCGGTALGEVAADACTGLLVGLARLTQDGTALDGDLALGCSDDAHVSLTIDGGDLDGDGRAELSIAIAERATYVVDVERFDVELAAWGTGFAFEHPEGTGLETLFCPRGEEETLSLSRRAASPWTEPPSASFDFDDVPDGCEVSVVPYDAEADCWRYGLR
jgi:hypothetical protein